MRARARRYLYGKAHSEKYPYHAKVRVLFEECIDQMRALKPGILADHRLNNLMIDLRNRTYVLVDEMYKELKVQLAHGISLRVSTRRRPLVRRETVVLGKRCEVCGEVRAVNICHIIAREMGGRDQEDNYLFLCPTHHFLFDEARLTRAELEHVQLDGKAEDSVAYFRAVHFSRHEMYWRYGTNRFTGCECGSTDFAYATDVTAGEVRLALQCTKCGEKWLNVWTDLHPASRVRVKAFGKIDPGLSEGDKNLRIRQAEEQVREWIAAHPIERDWVNGRPVAQPHQP